MQQINLNDKTPNRSYIFLRLEVFTLSVKQAENIFLSLKIMRILKLYQANLPDLQKL